MEKGDIGLIVYVAVDFLVFFYVIGLALLTDQKIGYPIAKARPDLVFKSIGSRRGHIGLYALFYIGSDAQKVAEELGLGPKLRLFRLLWLPLPIFFVANFFYFLLFLA